MKKETIKKSNKVTSIYELKVQPSAVKEILDDIQKSYSNKTVTVTVQS